MVIIPLLGFYSSLKFSGLTQNLWIEKLYERFNNENQHGKYTAMNAG